MKASHCWRPGCQEITNRPSHHLCPLLNSVRDTMRLWVPRVNLVEKHPRCFALNFKQHM